MFVTKRKAIIHLPQQWQMPFLFSSVQSPENVAESRSKPKMLLYKKDHCKDITIHTPTIFVYSNHCQNE